MKIDIVFAETDVNGVNVGQFKTYFPNAVVHPFELRNLPPIGERNNPHFWYRMNDYWKVAKLLEMPGDIAISFDADMRIISTDVFNIVGLTKRFGLCLPANSRLIVEKDNCIGRDAQRDIPEAMNTMHAFNCGIISLDKMNPKAVECVKTFLGIMETRPTRGPMAWAEAVYASRFFPCLLPIQWCVCAENVGCDNEIILHVGHEKVREFYRDRL